MQKVTTLSNTMQKPLIKKVLKPVAMFALFVAELYDIVDETFFMEDNTTFDRLFYWGSMATMIGIFIYTMLAVY